MKFSISIAMSEANHYVPLAQAAERIGYHAIVLPDSIFFSEEVSAPYPYTTDGKRMWGAETPWIDPFVGTAAMAGATESIFFYTSVVKLAVRNPVLVAKQVGSLTVSSRRRRAKSDKATTGWARGVMPLVSTARMVSTIEKKSFIWVNKRALSVGVSASRARLAMRAISVDVRDMVLLELKPKVIRARRGFNGAVSRRAWVIILRLVKGLQNGGIQRQNTDFLTLKPGWCKAEALPTPQRTCDV